MKKKEYIIHGILALWVIAVFLLFNDRFIINHLVEQDVSTWSVNSWTIEVVQIVEPVQYEDYYQVYSWSIHEWENLAYDIDITDLSLTWTTIHIQFANNSSFTLSWFLDCWDEVCDENSGAHHNELDEDDEVEGTDDGLWNALTFWDILLQKFRKQMLKKQEDEHEKITDDTQEYTGNYKSWFWYMIWLKHNRDNVLSVWKNKPAYVEFNHVLADVQYEWELDFMTANVQWWPLYVKVIIQWKKEIK